MERTIKRDLMLGTTYITLRNGFAGFSVIAKHEDGKVIEEKYFNGPKEAKRYALESWGVYFE